MPRLTRGRRKPRRGQARAAGVLDSIMTTVAGDLWQAWTRAQHYKQTTDRGDVREDGVTSLLTDRLPKRFRSVRAEVADAFGNRSRQVDVTVFDESRCAPLVDNQNLVLLPAEALLAGVEVKSTLTSEDLEDALKVAESLCRLKPYGKPFERSRTGGAGAKAPRYFFTLFAYETDLVSSRWPQNEWERFTRVATNLTIDGSVIDRVVVLDRGFIAPHTGKYKIFSETEQSQVLHSWFTHLANFLDREAGRRNEVDLMVYSPNESRNWRSFE